MDKAQEPLGRIRRKAFAAPAVQRPFLSLSGWTQDDLTRGRFLVPEMVEMRADPKDIKTQAFYWIPA